MCDAAQLSIVSKNASISLLNSKSAIEHGAFSADLLGNQAVGPAPARGWAHAPTIARLMDPLEYSRYARQLVAARPELREELERAKDSGWTREAMQSFLREQGAGDDDAASNLDFFTRLGRRLIAALDERTADGFVFRVDMRLRPWGDSGAIATSFDALEEYFVTQGREWERYAWIKARALGPDPGNAALAAIVRPFVYRKYLDYGAFAAMRELHAQIREEGAKRELSD